MPELNPAQFEGETHDYEGTPGNLGHITRVMHGTLPTSALADLPGAHGEVPGEHRNRQGERWTSFIDDIRAHGVQRPVFVTVDPLVGARLSEGNHRRDAAVQVGHPRLPVEIRYYGHAERGH